MRMILKRARDVIGVEGTEGRNPFEQLMLLWAMLTILNAFSAPASDTVLDDLPSWVVTGCYILLCTGGLVGLVGVWLKSLILSLLVERIAMLIAGSSAVFFAGAILSQGPNNPRAWSVGLTVFLFALASFWRGYRVQTFLHRYRTQLRKAAEE